MGERDQLVRRIEERIARYEESGRPDHVASLEALTEAGALLRLLASRGDGHRREGTFALGRLFWSRFSARPGSDEGWTDLSTAFELANRLCDGNPLAMPDYFRQGLQGPHRSHVEAYATAADDHRAEERLAHAERIVRLPPSQRTGEEVQQAAEDSRQALRHIPVTAPNYPTLLSIKGHALALLFHEDGSLALLEEAERVRRQVLALCSPDEPDRAEALSNLIFCLQRRWEHLQDPAAVRECASLARELANALPEDPERRLMAQFWLGRSLRALAEDSGDTELLELSVTLLRGAAETAAELHDVQARVDAASELCSALLHRYRTHRSLPDLREALAAATLASSVPHPGLTAALTKRMVVASELVEATHEQQAMLETAQLAKDAVEMATEQGVDPLPYHRQLIDFLSRFHKLSGNRDWLWQAVVAARDARTATPPDHPDRPVILTWLCSTLLDHYEAQPNHTTLNEALRAGQEAFHLSREDAPERGHHLLEFGRALYLAAAVPHSHRRAYVAFARAITEEALEATPSGHPDRWAVLNQLGACLYGSFQLDGTEEHLTRAVAVTREALQEAESLSQGRAERANSLNHLTTYLSTLAEHEVDEGHGDEALETARRAAAAAPDNGWMHRTLGDMLKDRYERERLGPERARQTLDEARQALTTAAGAAGVSPLYRIDACRSLAWAHMTAQDVPGALEALEQAVALLPRVSSRLLWRPERQYGLAQTSGLAAEAASVAVAVGRPERAVELLEQARGTMLAQTMDRRGMMAILEESDPELATSYDNLLQRAELYDTDPNDLTIVEIPIPPGEEGEALRSLRPPTRAGGEGSGDRSAEAVYQHAYAQVEAELQLMERQWEHLLPRIRRIPGLEDFMLPLSATVMRQEVAQGPIVMVNASRYGGHVLIVTESQVRGVPLEGVDETTVADQVDRLDRARRSLALPSLRDRKEGQQTLSALLAWLWEHIAGPVLDALGHTDPIASDSTGPRIWWCPIGAAAQLPLHAAGHHTETSFQSVPRTVLDRAVSSYTPTIRALRHARRTRGRHGTETGGHGDVLIVSVPEVPGLEGSALHGALAEARRVGELIPRSRHLSGADAHFAAVHHALHSHGMVHLACHGISDWGDPNASRLLLHDHDEHPLTVGLVAKSHLPGAALAYLSACDTTQGAPGLHDEALHITSAFQLAGYRRVIGTLWPVDDEAARHIAGAFYATLTRAGTAPPRPEQTFHALHHAVRELRNQCGGRSPSLWAGHVHVGI
ncbi:CHAT domain-containing protein [Streptomyces phaeochromogenes]|uniref:CHAT domain-containing protein n=1 Tax=Streptomyces phaeochromogenes TaxID=1923 RepID=UPI003691778A